MLPSRLRPMAKSGPATSTLMPRVSRSSPANVLALSRDRAASKVACTTRSAPVSRSSRTRSLGTVR